MIKKKKYQNGFSLIELMVVFSLVAIVSGIGLASFVSYSRKQTLTQAAYDFKLTIEVAKFNALSSIKQSSSCSGDSLVGYKVVLCAKSLGGTCPGSNAPSNFYEIYAVCGSGLDNSLVSSKKLPDNVSIVTNDTDCTEIKFDSLSNYITGVPCSIKLQGYGATQTLSLDSGGNVAIN
ncbi:MAG: hypothetical protein COX79_01250 [Candidatus Levybacteria bacterium CG_4_10_14_0_2_um_filter_36_16]|nr:MAG: hypothetical protein AUK12_04035 [Candidatus Levybacteria bacterium CG2_30_37_29]PIR79637.1 MAG: hypothetical protein COU26_00045 [Candidatus Levybacteria bacterium CG10_big_fil_rev_8_21_14_0_10_36_30]PIZ97761.1 MAG: hypothetical protein COX79_01250 [Candidatus Levybacteria bacterium CG_4_10_14_0_2_um_filter_36_16]PJA90629.1 MAG: hypothetical protein CO136_01485 [Candidatus Levybacteria bacterium CG_4_9_14_3_um_filter_36_7]